TGSLNPIDCRSTARSASGASGIIRAIGSPLTWRMENVTSDTPTITTTRRASRRIRIAVMRGRGVGRRPDLFLRLGVVEREPLDAPRRVLDLLRHAERIVLGEQEERWCLLADQPLDPAVRRLALGLVERRAPLVDERVQPFDADVPLADPTSGLRVIEG